ncbi:hypothetical protein HOP50_17g79760 [Chloropicon primus]|nr:hypothetical protein HOP50_17g79760 [Chloropicon primus]
MAMAVLLGYVLTAIGVGFMFLGALLFFNASLMKTGNWFFIPGVLLTFGVEDTLRMCFLTKGNRRGTVAFFLGLFLITRVSALVGFLLQCYAIWLLLTGNYEGFLSTLIRLVKMLPVIGPVFDTVDDIPWVQKQLAKAGVRSYQATSSSPPTTTLYRKAFTWLKRRLLTKEGEGITS